MRNADFTGVLLAGGQSRRFGSNKALAPVAGCHLIEHPARVLATVFSRLLLVTNTPTLYSFLDWPMVADLFPGGGPLAGIQAALNHVDTPFIFVAGCDMPALNPEMISFLCERATGFDVVLPVTGDGPEPLHAVYGKTALPTITAALDSGVRKIQEVFRSLRIRSIPPEEWPRLDSAPEHSFRNINFKNDLDDEQP